MGQEIGKVLVFNHLDDNIIHFIKDIGEKLEDVNKVLREYGMKPNKNWCVPYLRDSGEIELFISYQKLEVLL